MHTYIQTKMEIRAQFQYKKCLGEEKFERKKLEKMERIDGFLVNHGEYPLHTVHDIGIRRCLEEWYDCRQQAS